MHSLSNEWCQMNECTRELAVPLSRLVDILLVRSRWQWRLAWKKVTVVQGVYVSCPLSNCFRSEEGQLNTKNICIFEIVWLAKVGTRADVDVI
jgi:hypothetical protein